MKKIKVQLAELKKRMADSLVVRGVSRKRAEVLVEPYVEAELCGKTTHGLSKFFRHHDTIIKTKPVKPLLLRNKFNHAFIDGKKELGHIVSLKAVSIALAKANRFGSSTVGMRNAYWFSMTGTYARMIAERGYIGIVLNNGGRSVVAPFGGSQAVFGTNPVAIAIPTPRGPILLDMATSLKPWGEVELAKMEKRQLPADVFFDKNGKVTQDPYQAVAIKPFEGYKGYGLNFMFEILTGAFVAAKMGWQTKTTYDLGFLFMVFSPTLFTSKKKFGQGVRALVKDVKRSKKLPGVKEIFLPGEQSDRKRQAALRTGTVVVEESAWLKLAQLL